MDRQQIYEARKAIENIHRIPILTLAFNVINRYHAYDGHDRLFMCNPCYCQGRAMFRCSQGEETLVHLHNHTGHSDYYKQPGKKLRIRYRKLSADFRRCTICLKLHKIYIAQADYLARFPKEAKADPYFRKHRYYSALFGGTPCFPLEQRFKATVCKETPTQALEQNIYCSCGLSYKLV